MSVDEKITKETIFKTAARLFAKKGYNGVSMREISEMSNVSKPTIYYYFGSKDGIYEQLMDTGIDHIQHMLEEVSEMPISAKEKLTQITKRVFKETGENPDYIKLFISMSQASGDSAVSDKCRRHVEETSELVKQIIRDGVQTGEFGAGASPELAAEIFGGVIMNFVWKQLASKEKILSDQLAENIIELLFKGLNE